MSWIRNTGEKYYYHGDGLLDGGMGGHAQVVVAAPHSDLLRTPRELPEKKVIFHLKSKWLPESGFGCKLDRH
jgi:hypothetical protein